MGRPIFILASYLLVISCNNSVSHAQVANMKYKTIGTIERIDKALDNIISPNAQAEIIAEGFDWSEGPVWVESQKMLLFSDVPQNIVYKWTEEKGKEIYLTPSGYTDSMKRAGEMGSNGLLLDASGHLVLCQHGNRQVARMDAPIHDPKPKFISIASNYMGKKLNSPNDAVYNSGGELFFTDPPYAEKIQYGELNFVWEAWLGLDTRWHEEEIIVNDVRGKCLGSA